MWAILHGGGDAPEVWASVEGSCTPMDLIYGLPGDGTYEALADAGPDDRWTIQTRLTDGSEAIWPDVGAWDADDHDADAVTANCLHPQAGGGDDDDMAPGLEGSSGCDCTGSDGSPFGGGPSATTSGFAAIGLVLVFRRRTAPW